MNSTDSSRLNILERLPRELLPRVLLSLDHLSLHSLFRASSYICRQCVLIVDEFDPIYGPVPTLFTDLPDLRNVPLKEYNPSRHRSRVKIFLVTFKWRGIDDARASYTSEYLKKRFPYLDKSDSIVCYVTPSAKWAYKSSSFESLAQQEITRALAKESVAVHIIPQAPKDTLVTVLDDAVLNSIAHPVRDLEGHLDYSMCNLRLEGMETIEGVTFPPMLQVLTIVFHQNTVPVLRNVSFASLELELHIYYEDRVPFLEQLCFIGEETEHEQRRFWSNTLVLGHVPSLPGHLIAPLPTHPDEGRDLSFLSQLTVYPRQFGHFKIIGGPNSIVDNLDLRGAMRIEWKQTCQPIGSDFYFTTINANNTLIDFKFDTLLKNARCPRLIISNRNQEIFQGISVMGCNGLDISALAPIPESITCLSIISSSRDPTHHVSSISEIAPTVFRADGGGDYHVLKLEGLKLEEPYATRELLDQAIKRACW